MDRGQIVITGTVRTDADRWDALVDLALDHVRRSRTEPGCISHDAYASVEEPHRLFFFERWLDRAAVDAHFARPESRDFVARLTALAVETPTLSIDPLA